MFSIGDNGPYERQGDVGNTGLIASLLYQPQAMRFRGVSVLTNTPPRGPQSQPGGLQAVALMEPIIAKAARKLGIDQVAIRRINAPVGKALFGPAGVRGAGNAYVTSAFVQEALDKGAALFKWDVRKNTGKAQRAASGNGSAIKCGGVGVAVSTYSAGSVGYDGLFVIKPDGRLYIQSGIGNHGTASVSDCHRVSAELLGMPWDKCEVTWGDTAKNLPWTCNSGGSQTIHAMTRAAHAAGMDATKKLQEIAAKDLGGKPEDYEVGNERVFRKGGGAGMTLAHAAQRAIDLGGAAAMVMSCRKTSPRSSPEPRRTRWSGQGLMGVARDDYPHDGQSRSFVAGFAEVEIDVETGKFSHPGLSGRRGRRHRDPPAARSADSRSSAARCWASGMRSGRRGWTTSTTASRWPSDSITTSRRPFSTRRRTCSGPRWICRIRKRPLARVALASRQWALVAVPF